MQTFATEKYIGHRQMLNFGPVEACPAAKAGTNKLTSFVQEERD
jgi:hypothetical protein